MSKNLKNKNKSILFFGTSEFAIPSLEALLREGYRVLCVVANPDKPAGRTLKRTPPPAKNWATKNKVPVWQPVDLKNGKWKMEMPEADIFIVAAYGKIIPREIFDAPKYKTLNIHPSLLPRWRGPSPIQYTILHGDKETGVTIIQMDEKMDHGPILAQTKFQPPIKSGTNLEFSYLELHNKLAKLGSRLLLETLPRWITGEIAPMPQDHRKATYSHKLTKESGRIDWSRSAKEIERMVRAFTPWPGAWTLWNNKRIRIDQADTNRESVPKGKPGFLLQNNAGELLVQTGNGNLLIHKLTPESKKTMDAQSFLRGNPHVQFLSSTHQV